MNNIIKTLENIGFSKKEADIYLAILANGPISAGKIAKLTNNYRSNTYQAIERLISKGFVSESTGKASKLYQALSPDHILTEQEDKLDLLKEALPQLKRIRSESTTQTEIRIINGVNGWRHLLNEFLDIGEERVVYGVPNDAVELMKDFFTEYHKKRAKRKISLRHIFNYDARKRLKITNSLPFTKSRYLPEQLDQPVSTSICGSLIAITSYEKDNILTLVIDNKTIASSYKKYFEFLWKLSKKK